MTAWKDRSWPVPPFRDTQIIGFRIAALHQIAERHPVESPIAVRGQQQPVVYYDCDR